VGACVDICVLESFMERCSVTTKPFDHSASVATVIAGIAATAILVVIIVSVSLFSVGLWLSRLVS
jgi:hypothetical protein